MDFWHGHDKIDQRNLILETWNSCSNEVLSLSNPKKSKKLRATDRPSALVEGEPGRANDNVDNIVKCRGVRQTNDHLLKRELKNEND